MKAAYSHHFGIPFDESDVFWQKHWEAAWKASRAKLVIELPYEACNGMMNGDRVRAAIEAAGVKVKP